MDFFLVDLIRIIYNYSGMLFLFLDIAEKKAVGWDESNAYKKARRF